MGGTTDRCYVSAVTWFDRCRGDSDPQEAWDLLNATVERSGVQAALHAACGPRGLRWFIVRFEVRSGRGRIVQVISEPLRQGGGPPPPAAFDEAAPAIERAVATLHRTLPPTWRFDRGAVGVVRDGAGQLDLRFRFDEDADALSLTDLRPPAGDAHPVEDPTYLRTLRSWEQQVARMRSRWELAAPGEVWRFSEGRLHVGDATPRPGEVIATWTPGPERLEWLLGEPLADERPFIEATLSLTLSEAVELVAFAAARRRDASVYQGTTERGVVVFVGLRS